MKYLISLIVAVLFILTFAGSCDCNNGTATGISTLKIGDKFIYHNQVDIARADDNVVVYRRWTWSRYYYYSTTRKDSIIYKIRSVVSHK